MTSTAERKSSSMPRNRSLRWQRVDASIDPVRTGDQRRESDRSYFVRALNGVSGLAEALAALYAKHQSTVCHYLKCEITNLLITAEPNFPSISQRLNAPARPAEPCVTTSAAHSVQELHGRPAAVPGVVELNADIRSLASRWSLFNVETGEGLWVVSAFVRAIAMQNYAPNGRVTFQPRPFLALEKPRSDPPKGHPSLRAHSGLDWRRDGAMGEGAGCLEHAPSIDTPARMRAFNDFMTAKRQATEGGTLASIRTPGSPLHAAWLSVTSVTVRESAGWDPTTETENSFRARVENYISSVLEGCKQHGLVQSPHTSASGKEATELMRDDELSWLIRRYADRMSPAQISRSDAAELSKRKDRPVGYKAIPTKTVNGTIKRLAAWLGLPAPPVLQKGRPRSR